MVVARLKVDCELDCAVVSASEFLAEDLLALIHYSACRVEQPPGRLLQLSCECGTLTDADVVGVGDVGGLVRDEFVYLEEGVYINLID